MKATSERIGEGLAKMTVELEPAELQSEYEQAVKRISGRAKIPGFRPGRAPRTIVESMFGKQAILSEALEHLVPSAYDRAIIEQKLEPVDQPDLALADVELDKPFSFTATVPIRPTVILGDVETITLSRQAVAVIAEEEDVVLEQLRRARGEMAPIEGRPLASGDGAEMRLSLVAGEMERTWEKPLRLVVGNNWLPEGFDAKVVGMEISDVRVFDLDLPPDYHDEQLRNKRATCTVELLSMSAPVLPELTDQFAASVSDFATLGLLRENIRQRLLERKTREAELELREAALDSLVARSSFEVPQVLIDRRTDEILRARTNIITAQGIALETYLGSIGKTPEEWKLATRDDATRDVRRAVAIEHFASARGVEVEEAEIEAEVDRLALQYPESEREAVKRAYGSSARLPHLRHTIRDRKALDVLMNEVMVEDSSLADLKESTAAEAGAAEGEAASTAAPSADPERPG